MGYGLKWISLDNNSLTFLRAGHLRRSAYFEIDLDAEQQVECNTSQNVFTFEQLDAFGFARELLHRQRI